MAEYERCSKCGLDLLAVDGVIVEHPCKCLKEMAFEDLLELMPNMPPLEYYPLDIRNTIEEYSRKIAEDVDQGIIDELVSRSWTKSKEIELEVDREIVDGLIEYGKGLMEP